MVARTVASVPGLSAVRSCGAGTGGATGGGAVTVGSTGAVASAPGFGSGFASVAAGLGGVSRAPRPVRGADPDVVAAGTSATGSITGSGVIGTTWAGGAGMTS